MQTKILTQLMSALQQNIQQLDQQNEDLRKQVYQLSDEYYEQLIELERRLFQQLEQYNDVCVMLGKQVDGLDEDVLGLEGIQGRYQQQIGQLQIKKIQLQKQLKTHKQTQQSNKTILAHHAPQLTQSQLTYTDNKRKHKYLLTKQKQLDTKIQTLSQHRRHINNIKTQELLNYQNNSCSSHSGNSHVHVNVNVNVNVNVIKNREQFVDGCWKNQKGWDGSKGKGNLGEEEDTLETVGSKRFRGNFCVADEELASLNQFCL